MDYKELAVGLDNLRETLRAMVAGVMQEGFSEEQAREIVTGVFAANRKD
jgi:hypothetical protein